MSLILMRKKPRQQKQTHKQQMIELAENDFKTTILNYFRLKGKHEPNENKNRKQKKNQIK